MEIINKSFFTVSISHDATRGSPFARRNEGFIEHMNKFLARECIDPVSFLGLIFFHKTTKAINWRFVSIRTVLETVGKFFRDKSINLIVNSIKRTFRRIYK